MNGKEYMQTQIAMIEMGKKIQSLDLDAFLKCLDNAETAIPQLPNPEIQKRARDNIVAVRKLTKTYQLVKAEMQATQESILQTTLAYMTAHDPQCDVDPSTLTWKRDFKKGETTKVCPSCAERVKAAGRVIGSKQ